VSGYLEGLAMLLSAKGIALWSPDGPSSIFIDYLPERTEHSLALFGYGGDGEWPQSSMSFPRVQVLARGDQRSPRWSREKVEAAYRVLHGFDGVLPNGVHIPLCYGLESAPNALGPDASGRYEHSSNFQLWVCPVPMEAISNG
jgi:hypothetical protein